MSFARKRGVFGFYNKWTGSEKCLKELIDTSVFLGFSEDDDRFLCEKYSIRWLKNEYKNFEKLIKKKIDEHHKDRIRKTLKGRPLETSLFMELLAFLDVFFRIGSNEAITINKSILNCNTISSYSIEDVSEAISYLIYEYFESDLLNKAKHIWMDARYVCSDSIIALIEIALKRNSLVEWEILIDYFGYSIIDDGSKQAYSNFVLSDNHVNIERSIRAGYVKTRLQHQVIAAMLSREQFNENNKDVSISELAFELENRMGDRRLFAVEGENDFFRRYKMFIDERIIKFLAPSDYASPSFFFEEKNEICLAAHDMFMSTNDLINYRISDHCTIKDVVLFKRFFSFYTIIQNRFFFKDFDKEEGVRIKENKRRYWKDIHHLKTTVRSLTPTFSKTKIIDIISVIVGNKEKVEELLNILTWNGSETLDLQYTPIIKIDDDRYYFIPYVLTSSNLIRNVIVKQRQRGYNTTNSNGKDERLEKRVEELILKCPYKYKYKKGLEYTYNENHGEIDFVLWSDKYLYVLECKNPFFPAGSFELRTTYDYIEKATRQLDLFEMAMSDDDFYVSMIKRLGISGNNDNLTENNNTDSKVKITIVSAIILGNRVFTIKNGFRYPVRYVYELETVLFNGIIRSSFGNWRIWKNKSYSDEDLRAFFSGDTALSEIFYSAMMPYEERITIKNYRVTYKTFSLDPFASIVLRNKLFDRIENDDFIRVDDMHMVQFIQYLAIGFRKRIDVLMKSGGLDYDTVFKRFPHGCCGDTSELLGQYLKENGIKTWYVCGYFYPDAKEEGIAFNKIQSHAWLSTGNPIDSEDYIIIDITGDQFKSNDTFLNYSLPVYVGKIDEFHRLFEVEKRDVHVHGGIDNTGDNAKSRLWKIYRTITDKITKTDILDERILLRRDDAFA